MAQPAVDWQRATLVGALVGGAFWGLAAGAILVAKASAIAITVIGVGAAAILFAGAVVNRRGTASSTRGVGMGLMLAPLTGAAPVLAIWLPGLVTDAIT
jgi:hypothetical protein